MKSIKTLVFCALVSMMALAGCSEKDNITNSNGRNSSDESNDNGNGGIQLNFYEEQILGLWARYHAYDGSMMYVYFNADRTACKWEEADGSNYRSSKSSYSNWSIDENNPVAEGRFKIVMNDGSFSYTFDYLADQIWPQSYSNLAYYPSSGKTCE